MSFWLTVVLVVLATSGCFYTVGAARAVRDFARRRVPAATAGRWHASVLKPLHGAEAGLFESLETFVHQQGMGDVQIVFGVADDGDPAIAVVRRLIGAYPARDIGLVVSGLHSDANGKIANLAAMRTLVKHDLVVVSDSDIRVSPSYLHNVCAALSEPGVGLVTCLYRGGPERTMWSMISTMAIDFQFFPSVLLGVRLQKARPCMGATMAMSTQTLERIGGFGSFSRHLADDYAIGEAVRATGQRVVIAGEVVVHQCAEQTVSEVLLHELRWARTIRSIDPVGYAGSFITYPVPFALLAVLIGGWPPVAVACLVASLGCRAYLQREVEKVMDVSTRRWLLGPLRDLLAFLVYVASFATDSVVWRGRRYRVRPDGTMTEVRRADVGGSGGAPSLTGCDDAPGSIQRST